MSTQECCVQERASLLRGYDGQGISVPVTIHVDKLMRPPVRPPCSSKGAPRERACCLRPWLAGGAAASRLALPLFAPPVVLEPTTASVWKAQSCGARSPGRQLKLPAAVLPARSPTPAPTALLLVECSLRPQGPGRLQRLRLGRRWPRQREAQLQAERSLQPQGLGRLRRPRPCRRCIRREEP